MRLIPFPTPIELEFFILSNLTVIPFPTLIELEFFILSNLTVIPLCLNWGSSSCRTWQWFHSLLCLNWGSSSCRTWQWFHSLLRLNWGSSSCQILANRSVFLFFFFFFFSCSTKESVKFWMLFMLAIWRKQLYRTVLVHIMPYGCTEQYWFTLCLIVVQNSTGSHYVLWVFFPVHDCYAMLSGKKTCNPALL